MKGIFEKNNLQFYIREVFGFLGFAPMFHSHVEIIYVISGSIEMNISGQKRVLLPGQASIAFPYAVHSYASAPDARVIILMFDPSVTVGFEKKLLSHWPKEPYLTQTGQIALLLERILHYAQQHSPDALQMAMIYLQVAIGEMLLALELVDIEETDIGTTQKLLIYCSEHYTEDISLKIISQNIFISQSMITKIFSGKLHCSFREYINRLRIAKARFELENTDKNITDVMNSCGFQNQSSFNRVFLQDCGVTPSQYRQRCRK